MDCWNLPRRRTDSASSASTPPPSSSSAAAEARADGCCVAACPLAKIDLALGLPWPPAAPSAETDIAMTTTAATEDTRTRCTRRLLNSTSGWSARAVGRATLRVAAKTTRAPEDPQCHIATSRDAPTRLPAVVLREGGGIGRECRAQPFQLAAHIVGDVTGLQLRWKDVPGVRLDLEVVRQRGLGMHLPRRLDADPRRPELADGVEEHRDVEVGPPLPAARGVKPPRSNGIRQVEEPRQLAVARLGGLAQIDGVRELLQVRHRSGCDIRDPQGRGRLQLEDGYAGRVQEAQRGSDVLELHRLMADVQDHAEVPAHQAMELAGR